MGEQMDGRHAVSFDRAVEAPVVVGVLDEHLGQVIGLHGNELEETPLPHGVAGWNASPEARFATAPTNGKDLRKVRQL